MQPHCWGPADLVGLRWGARTYVVKIPLPLPGFPPSAKSMSSATTSLIDAKNPKMRANDEREAGESILARGRGTTGLLWQRQQALCIAATYL